MTPSIETFVRAVAAPKPALCAPFHKERLLGGLGLHLAFASAFTLFPAYHAVHTCLAQPGAAAYCMLRGGC